MLTESNHQLKALFALHRDLYDISAAGTAHANLPEIGESADPPPTEGVLVDAVGTGEERDTDSASGKQGGSAQEEREPKLRQTHRFTFTSDAIASFVPPKVQTALCLPSTHPLDGQHTLDV